MPIEPELCVVIPARNEAKRLPQTLTRLASYQSRSERALEVIIVDDHSEDDTRFVAHQLASRLALRVVSGDRRGPGAAMRTGLSHARAPRMLLCDADGPVPFTEIETLWRAMDRGAALAAGSRLIGQVDRPRRPLIRRALALGWRSLVRTMSPTPVLDTQCGFKMMNRELVEEVLPHTILDGFVFHVELLAWSARLGFPIAEVPVPWRDVPGSSIRFLRDPVHMTGQLFDLRRSLRQRRNPEYRASHVPDVASSRPNRRQS